MVGSEISVVRESGMRGVGLIKPVSAEDLRRLCWDVLFEWRKIQYEDELKQLGDAGKIRGTLFFCFFENDIAESGAIPLSAARILPLQCGL
jgi:hypothetical protein